MNKTHEKEQAGVKYHIRPSKGLINDPNGLVYFKGKYHVFYQWNPHGTEHLTKNWGHAVSSDLVHWETLPPALEPSEWYDSYGCYSGSAVVKDDQLILFYTGTVKSSSGEKRSYQCTAFSKDGITFTKGGPVFDHPAGFTRHVRDPKVWQDEKGTWWMVLGAQTEELVGTVIAYSSPDLQEWTNHGPLLKEPLALGYMWECPDVLLMDQLDMLLFCPQGMEAEGDLFQNIFQTGYLLGRFTSKGTFQGDYASFRELDRGFEFYAPQTFVAGDGRRLMFAWMGAMELEVEQAVPTVQDGWVHHLSLPREITIEQGQVIQRPARELMVLRKEKRTQQELLENSHQGKMPSQECEMHFHWAGGLSDDFSVKLREELYVFYEADSKRLTVERTNWYTKKREVRRVRLEESCYLLEFFLEATSLEMFVNGGKEVFSLRYFTDSESLSFVVEGEMPEITAYVLEAPVVKETTEEKMLRETKKV